MFMAPETPRVSALPLLNLQTDRAADGGMEKAHRCPGIYDRLESLRARRILRRTGDVDWHRGSVEEPSGCGGGRILLAWNLQAHTEIGSQVFGVFTKTGSDTPVPSLFSTTSE